MNTRIASQSLRLGLYGGHRSAGHNAAHIDLLISFQPVNKDMECKTSNSCDVIPVNRGGAQTEQEYCLTRFGVQWTIENALEENSRRGARNNCQADACHQKTNWFPGMSRGRRNA